MKLTKIEADVVLVATVRNTDTHRFVVVPLWECGADDEQLREQAVQLTLQHVERAGSGYGTVEIFDFREGE